MEEIKTPQNREIKHIKRWEFYTIIAILVLVIGVSSWATYTYIWGPEEVITESTAPIKSAEEKTLTEVKTDLDADKDLDLSDLKQEIDELEAVDLSGV